MVKDPNRFGRALRSSLSARDLTQADLAAAIGTSTAYVSAIATSKNVSPERVDSIAKALRLPHEERVGLHRAAVKDLGFTLDLPDDFDD